MPTYVYACKSCDANIEVIQKMSDPPLTDCESCGGSLRRVLFPPAVVYKGSGFYVTDYKNAGKSGSDSAAGEKTGDAAPAKTETTTTKTESAPPAKTSPD